MRGGRAAAQAFGLCVALIFSLAGAAPAQPTARVNGQSTTRPELVLQTGYPLGGATGLTYSPDGRLLATTTFNSNQLKLWDVASGRELRTLAIGGGTVSFFSVSLTGISAVAFSRDGRLLAAGGRDNAITIWDTKTGRTLHTLQPGSEATALAGVAALVFSADARQLVAFSDAIRAWDTTSGQVLRETPLDQTSLAGFTFNGLTGGGGPALSADGSQLALLAGGNGQKRAVKIYDLASAREVRTLNVPDDFATCALTTLALTPDARVLGACLTTDSGGQSAKFKLWDLSARAAGRVLTEGKRTDLGLFGFSPGGRWLALSTPQNVKVFDTASGAERQTFASVKAPGQADLSSMPTAFAFSADEKFLAASGFSTAITVRDIESGRTMQTLAGHSNFAFGVAFSADGTRLVSGGRTIWDLTTGRGLRAARSAEPLGLMSRDGRLLAAATFNDSRITLYDTNTQRRLFTLTPDDPPTLKVAPANAPRAAQAIVQPPAFSPDGRLLATFYTVPADNTQPAQVDAKAAQKAQKEMLKNMSRNPAAAMQAYNDALAKASGRGDSLANQIKLWDTQTGREVRTLVVAGGNAYAPAQIKAVTFSADGRRLAVVAHNSAVVTLWDVTTGAQVGIIGAPPAPAAGANPYGLPGAGGQMPDIAQLPGMQQMFGGQANVEAVAFSADGRTLAVGGQEVTRSFDMAAMMGQMSAAMRDPKAAQANAAALQQQLLKQMKQTTAGTLKLYDAATRHELRAFAGLASEVKVIAFSPDGRLLASAATDNAIKLWDTGSGRELRTLSGHTAQINSLAFNPDISLLASASNDGSTLLWDVAQGRQLATLVSLYDGDDWLVATPDGLFDGSPQAWNQVLWRYDTDTFNVAPIEWFFNEFFSPGLLAELVAGHRPRAAADFADKDRRQPTVTIALADPAAANAPLATRNVRVRIEVRDAGPDATHTGGSGASDLRLFRNGSLVKVWRGDALKGQPANVFETTLPIVAGVNRLTAYAFNRDNVKSRDALLVLNGADALKRAGTAYILAIGVNEYANPQYNLRYAVADAREFGAEIERQQSKLGRYDHVALTTLTDREATKANITAALTKLAVETQPEDEVIVYFAGHGTAHENQFYLIPHDLGYDGSRTQLNLAALKSILAHSISDKELEAAFEGVNAGQLMFVIDACNSGQALEAEEKRRGPMNSKGLAQLAYEKGMYILTAAQSFQAAQEAAQVGHGLLTYALVEEGLKLAAADDEPKDGAVLAREWLDYATNRVPAIQIEKVKQARDLSFVEGDERGLDIGKRIAQRPRVFYRRELETQPLVVARP
jgi:WD40 repeat protein